MCSCKYSVLVYVYQYICLSVSVLFIVPILSLLLPLHSPNAPSSSPLTPSSSSPHPLPLSPPQTASYLPGLPPPSRPRWLAAPAPRPRAANTGVKARQISCHDKLERVCRTSRRNTQHPIPTNHDDCGGCARLQDASSPRFITRGRCVRLREEGEGEGGGGFAVSCWNTQSAGRCTQRFIFTFIYEFVPLQ